MGWLAGVKVATVAMLVTSVSACGSSEPPEPPGPPDRLAQRLPPVIDLDQLAGRRIAGSPSCRFENVSRTFINRAPDVVQDIGLACRGVAQFGNARTVIRGTPFEGPRALRCRREEKGLPTVLCGVQNGRLGVGAQVHCRDLSSPSPCHRESWPQLESDARTLVARAVEVVEPLEAATTPVSGIDAKALPRTVDLQRLAGRSFAAEPFGTCTFDDAPGTATIALRCGSKATGVVGIGEASGEAIPNPEPGTPDDIVVCSRGARQSVCHLPHGDLQLSTTVDCASRCTGRATPSALIAQLARFVGATGG